MAHDESRKYADVTSEFTVSTARPSRSSMRAPRGSPPTRATMLRTLSATSPRSTSTAPTTPPPVAIPSRH
ncbi:MAG: hypothetical protein ACLU37_09405 [Collinsella sp.]